MALLGCQVLKRLIAIRCLRTASPASVVTSLVRRAASRRFSAGIAGGAVYGERDRQAAYLATNPVTPLDYMATILHSLGVPRSATLLVPSGRPHAVYGGRPIEALFG
jgi:hypothetical protein